MYGHYIITYSYPTPNILYYTGDMQLTKAEVADSQLLVCTPEKYDVVTRKGGDQSLGTLVSLVIIDEVHLLADERGAVIETIVARTQRYVESSQKLVSSSNSSGSSISNVLVLFQ